jgi:hypothetical protein
MSLTFTFLLSPLLTLHLLCRPIARRGRIPGVCGASWPGGWSKGGLSRLGVSRLSQIGGGVGRGVIGRGNSLARFRSPALDSSVDVTALARLRH